MERSILTPPPEERKTEWESFNGGTLRNDDNNDHHRHAGHLALPLHRFRLRRTSRRSRDYNRLSDSSTDAMVHLRSKIHGV